MAKTVVIFGASGKQGRAVIDAFLGDSTFKVRAVLRNPISSAAQELQSKGVEVVQGDLLDRESLVKAFAGAHVIYAMTADVGVQLPSLLGKELPSLIEEAYRLERVQGDNLLAALATIQDTLELFIFSGLSAAKRLSDGDFQHIYHFDAKAEIIDYLEEHHPALVPKTVELQLGMFNTNLRLPAPVRPTKQKDGRYRVLIANSPDTPIPFIDPNHDPALFVKALASQTLPTPKSANKVRKFAGYARYTTFAQFVDLLNKHLSGEFYIEEVSVEAWAKEVPIPGFGLELAEMWKYVEKVGYFGGEKGETTIITELKLSGEPTHFENWFLEQDWSIIG